LAKRWKRVSARPDYQPGISIRSCFTSDRGLGEVDGVLDYRSYGSPANQRIIRLRVVRRFCIPPVTLSVP
jgi:hypothetical protein